VAFRGSAAIAAGVVTPKVLRGPRFLRVFPDTYVRAGAEPPDLRPRSLAAYRYVEGHGVLSGYSAAVLLGADCAPEDAPAEVTVSGGRRIHPGLRVHREELAADEVHPCCGVVVTSRLRTPTTWGDVSASSRLSSGSTHWPTRDGSIPRRSWSSRTAMQERVDVGTCAGRSPWRTGGQARRWRPG
jgi:hypothetical protein